MFQMPNRGSKEISPWQWQESANTARHGDGISRPKQKTKIREYTLRIHLLHGPPMIWTTKAESKRHAIRYAQARWPQCDAEVI